MTIHFLNGFTCNARIPRHWKCGTLELLVETEQGLVLVDTGLGTGDYLHDSGILRLFKVVTIVPLDPQEAVVRQVVRLGYRPEDVRHIVLTHMHFDHCGGLPDFPGAKIHVHRREYESFTGRRQRWTDMAYIRRHIAHRPEFCLYQGAGEKWYDFDAIRLPFEPEMWLVPLFGHTYGQCGVAVKLSAGWFFNAADAGAVYNDATPAWAIRLVLGPHDPRLRAFMHAHPEVRMANSHMYPEWFDVATYA